MIEPQYLLADDDVASFIIRGYTIVEPELPEGLNRRIFDALEALPSNPGDGILKAVPELNEVWDHPRVKGALASLLGHDYQMHPHRHCHKNLPGTRSQIWHQDSWNLPEMPNGHIRYPDHIQWVLAMYYPQDVSADMGPTALIPGTHFFTTAADRLASNGNFKDQVVATVKAGSVLLLHYDIWHAGTANTSDRVRYMIKFVFERTSQAESPSWRHDPDSQQRILTRLDGERAAPVQRSLAPKLIQRRRLMWNSIAGDGALPLGYWDRWAGEWPSRQPKREATSPVAGEGSGRSKIDS